MQRGRGTSVWIAAVAGAVLGTCTPAGGAAPHPTLESPSTWWAAGRTGPLDERGARLLSSVRWQTSAHRDGPTVRVSAAYGNDVGTAARWGNFFASLVHGPELALLDAYVATPEEVRSICGGREVLGCYGADKLVFADDASGGVSPEAVALHEYGHHVAYNRLNAPWAAFDWGTKRWASAMNVCSRVASRTAYPGAEDVAYPLNPAEAFAESYRVLNQTDVPFTWPIVDNSFRPDADALQALREDVLHPWTAPRTQTIHGHFAAGRRTWTHRLATPLDGTLSLELSTGSNDLRLLSADGRAVLAQSTWSRAGTKSIVFVVCGQRSLTLSVTRSGRSASFTVRVSAP